MANKTLRDCLKLVSWYVRERKMQHILRKNLLTIAANSKQPLMWDRTHKFLRVSFGVESKICPRSQYTCELYRKIEHSRLFPEEKTKEKSSGDLIRKAEDDFANEWSQMVT